MTAKPFYLDFDIEIPTAVAGDTFVSASVGAELFPATVGGVTSWYQRVGTTVASLTAPTGAAGGDLTGTYPNPTIGTNKVTNSQLAQMATLTIKGNNTGGTANAADLTANQVKTLLGITEADVAGLVSDLAAKAPLASPALTGTPTAPTAGAGTNNTQIATTAYADAKVENSVTAGHTTVAPSGDAVSTALSLKAVDSLVAHLAGTESFSGFKTFALGLGMTGIAGGGTYASGKLFFDTDNDCPTFFNSDSNVSLQIGQEFWVRVKNSTGSTIPNGSAVYINGTDGANNMPTIALAKADAAATARVAGVTTESIANGAIGIITQQGIVHGLNTTGYTAGAALYLSATTAGALTSTSPTGSNIVTFVGYCLTSNASTGAIDIAPMPGTLAAFAPVLQPKEINGVCYVSASNAQGWAGADVGAWINAAYAYLIATYPRASGDDFGGIIHVGPGLMAYTTPIVLEPAASFFNTVVLEGSGDGWGGTLLNYTAVSGIAITIGGGSGNTGGSTIRDLTLQGTAIGNGATGVQIGNANGGGATSFHNVAILRFTNGIVSNSANNAYAVNLWNTKVQYCTTGWQPLGENNVMFGGLIGSCGTGVSCPGSAGIEVTLTGVALDDMTGNSISIANGNARVSTVACRFENPSGTTNTQYVSISAGVYNSHGDKFQNDTTTSTVLTGFIQGTGGVVVVTAPWISAGGAGSLATFTQMFNPNASCSFTLSNPTLAPNGTVGMGPLLPATWQKRAVAASAGLTTTQTIVASVPIPANTQTAGQTYKLRAAGTQSTTAGTVTYQVHCGTAGTTADATVSAVTAAAAASGGANGDFLFTIRTIGSGGTCIAEGTGIGSGAGASVTTATTAINTTVANVLSISLAVSAGTHTNQVALIEPVQP